MALRFTNTDKWNDHWFCELKPIEKLLFIYICDNCDIAGFIETNYKKWAFDIGSDKKIIEGALKGLQRGLIFSETNDCIYIKNFLKHQKNLPLNTNNKAHLGIIKRFELYSFKFKIENINSFIEGASKGLNSPYGIGIGIGNGIEEEIKDKKEAEYITFYNTELSKTNDEDYHKFVKWILGDNEIKEPFVKCLNLKHQLSCELFYKYRKLAQENNTTIMSKVRSLENNFTKYKPVSLSLTLSDWLVKKDVKK